MKISIENENTFRKSLKEGFNLFIGSGFSVLAKDHQGKSMPVGSQLKDELVKFFGIQNYSSLELHQVATILKSQQRDAFDVFLKDRFSVTNADARYYCLDNLNIKSIFTTNIDTLVYKIYENGKNHYLNLVAQKGPSFREREAIDLIPLHGSILNEQDPPKFSSFEITSAFNSDKDIWYFFTQRLQSLPTLFWGHSLQDVGVIQALNPSTVQGREHQDKWIIVDKNDEGIIQYFKAMDFKIILADTDLFLNYLDEISKDFLLEKPKTNQTNLVFDDIVPDFASVKAVQSLLNFYLGEPPNWYNIYSSRIYKTSHYAKVKDSIDSRRHTIVIGIPACGKTTLMMQIAAEYRFDGYKLIFNCLTKEKITLVLNKLNNEKAIIFIDNFADSLEAVQIILNSSNILLVAFDRSYNFDIVSHKIPKTGCNIIDITELTARDIQEIFDKIPLEVRPFKKEDSITTLGVSPSVYEMIQNHIVEAKLGDRFGDVLNNLEKQDYVLRDLLIMLSYVHTCRTPVSFDMVFSFLRGLTNSYRDVYNKIETLGKLICEYYATLMDDLENQDYFMPRSSVVSEAILNKVSPHAFKNVLLRFHKNVYPMRICRFDVFKRKAFDANFAKKAFSEWQEGRDFYEMIYKRDKSPYLKQQGALYFLYKKRFLEAFQWIDDALLQSKNEVFSIRNSHAIILFKANIHVSQNENVRQTLNQSMNILAECYNSDYRKIYHAKVFAEQALQYSEIYSDQISHDYLKKADEWLTEEKKKPYCNKEIDKLSKEIKSSIDNLEMADH